MATLDFEGMPEFQGDGHGCGTPEFRKQLEAYFHLVTAATRHALGVLGISQRKIATFAAENPEAAEAMVGLLKRGEDHATQLLRLLRAAPVREICGIVLSEMEAESDDDTAAAVQSWGPNNRPAPDSNEVLQDMMATRQ
jgi:hypothetical protein